MISFVHRGNFKKTTRFFERSLELLNLGIFDYYGREGVTALEKATPRDTGKTAESWEYRIIRDRQSVTIEWLNTNVNKDVNIAVILQYGHGLAHGGYVKGIDYINPAMRPIFNKIADESWNYLVKRK